MRIKVNASRRIWKWRRKRNGKPRGREVIEAIVSRSIWREEAVWNEIPLTTLTRGTLVDWLMVTVLADMYAHLCPFTYARCALRAKRLATKQTRDFRPTSQRQDAVKTDFTTEGDFFVAPTDACFPSTLFPSTIFVPFRENIRAPRAFLRTQCCCISFPFSSFFLRQANVAAHYSRNDKYPARFRYNRQRPPSRFQVRSTDESRCNGLEELP